jgi:hypothetical protein
VFFGRKQEKLQQREKIKQLTLTKRRKSYINQQLQNLPIRSFPSPFKCPLLFDDVKLKMRYSPYSIDSLSGTTNTGKRTCLLFVNIGLTFG